MQVVMKAQIPNKPQRDSIGARSPASTRFMTRYLKVAAQSW